MIKAVKSHTIIVLFILLNFFSVQAQFSEERVISTTANGTRGAVTGDIDGDGDQDVAVSNNFGDSLTWYENLDGLGNFSSEKLIASLNEPIPLVLADLDGDNDLDLIAIQTADQLVIWFENLDGLGNFSNKKVISDEIVGGLEIAVGDVDNDSDLDIIIGSDSSGIVLFNNVNGQAIFDSGTTVDIIPNARVIRLGDINGDGNLDIVSGSSGAVTVSWYENLGNATFGSQNIIAGQALAVASLELADLDNDGNLDIVAGTGAEDTIRWYRNTGESGAFEAPIVFTETADGIRFLASGDIDNDGDLDIIGASGAGDKVTWYENLDGLGNISDERIISDNTDSVFTAVLSDIDNDGDLDAVSASRNDDKVAWYENFTVLSTSDLKKNVLQIYPNPTATSTYLEIPNAIKINKIQLIDLSGKIILTVQKDKRIIDMSNLPNGIYFIRVTSDTGVLTKRLIKA